MEIQEEIKKAYEYAVRLLSFRLRTEYELKSKLKGKGFSEEVIHKIVEDCKTSGYVNDERFAGNLVMNLINYKNYAFYKVKMKLMQMGFEAELIENTLNELYTSKIEMEVISKVLKKTKLPKGESKHQEMIKLAQKLKQRGFRIETIKKAIFTNSSPLRIRRQMDWRLE